MKKTPIQKALASRRGKGMDITIILGGKPEIETEAPEMPEKDDMEKKPKSLRDYVEKDEE
jgi:hypothetical protein